MVCSIWDQVLQKLPSMQLEAGRAVRVDLGHEDWEDKVECPASPKALFKEVPDTPPSNASWDVIPADKPAITKVAADEVPPASGSTDGDCHHGPKGSHQSLQHAPTGRGWSHSGVRLEAGAAQDFGAGGAGLPCGAGDVPGVHPMFPAFHFPEHVDGRGALCSTGLRGLHLPLLEH